MFHQRIDMGNIIMSTKPNFYNSRILIDFHSHILPFVDDGAADVSSSQKLLENLKKQHADAVVLTPHFYLYENDVSSFLNRRHEAFDLLVSHCRKEDNPEYILGAEVYFLNRLYEIENIEKLCMGDSNYILIELPYNRDIDTTIVNELKSFINYTGFTVILAHLERYLRRMNGKIIRDLSYLDVICQINADTMFAPIGKKIMKLMLRHQIPVVLGTDCHNLKDRVPDNFLEGYQRVEALLSDKQITKFRENIRYIYEGMKK